MNESPRLLTRLFDPDGSPRDRAMWLVFAGIAASLLLAFFTVCVHQVERAQARHLEARQSAVPDCVAPGLRCASQTADATPRTQSDVR
jgi:hypothetical protein